MVARALRVKVFTIGVVLISSCGEASPSSKLGAGWDTMSCPTERVSVNGKIRHETFIRMHPTALHEVAVTVTSPKVRLGSCADAENPVNCDESLTHARAANDIAIACVLSSIDNVASDDRRLSVQAVWYGTPALASSGHPVPIGTAFAARLSVEQIDTLAAHSLVAAIEPAPGQGAGLIGRESMPTDCPRETEPAEPKLADAAQLRGTTRQPVVVEYRDEGVLPALIQCEEGLPCDEATARLWERTILNTRQVTCVMRWIDLRLSSPPERWNYGSGSGQTVPLLPPFGQAPATTKSQGLMLNWEEAVEVAQHPHVERVWYVPGGAAEPVTCMPDLAAPIHSPECPSEREDGEQKIEPRTVSVLQSADAPVDLIIQVAGGAAICPLDSCTGRCPPPEDVFERWRDENRASQACVRTLIEDAGGTASPDVEWLLNTVSARLTWAQAQAVATHPHVRRITVSSS